MTQGQLDHLNTLCQPPYRDESGLPLTVLLTKEELAEILRHITDLEDRLMEAAYGEDL